MLYIIHLVNNINIPNINFSGGYIKGINFDMKGNPSNVQYYLKEQENAFCFSADSITTDIEIDKIYYKKSIFEFDAKVKYEIDRGLSMHQCYSFGVQVHEGKQLPAINVLESKIEIDPKRSDIKITGNIAASLLSGIKNLMAN